MSRVYNFSAGPAVLPEEVLKEAADEMMDYRGYGKQIIRKLHLMHGSASYQHAGGLFHILG